MSKRLIFIEARANLKHLEKLENRIVFYPLNFDGNLLMNEEEVRETLSVSLLYRGASFEKKRKAKVEELFFARLMEWVNK